MYNVKLCGLDELRNTGNSDCLNLIGAHARVMLLIPGTEIDTYANAKLEATWQALIQERKAFPLYDVMGFEDQSEDDGVLESTTGLRRIPTSQGNYQFEYHFVPPVYNMVNAFSFNGRAMDVVIIDGSGKVIGTSPDGTKFKGFTCKRVIVNKIKMAEGKDDAAKIPFVLELTNPVEYKEKFATIDVDFMDALSGLHDVSIEIVGTAPATTDDDFTFKVTKDSDGTAVTGLVVTDFICYEDGVDFTLSTLEESAITAGTYTVTAAEVFAAAEYIFSLKDSEDMTTEGYDGVNTIEFETE